MIDRYTLPDMRALWSERRKFEVWLEVELLACEAWEQLGTVPAGTAQAVRSAVRIDPSRIDEIEAEVNHDVIAFLTHLSEQAGDPAKHIHYGLTSSDVVDTALAVRMRDAMQLIIAEAESLSSALVALARRHRNTAMIGRTHGVHAEPMTFGLKVAVWQTELARGIERLRRAELAVSAGKMSGAVGTYGNLEPEVEAQVCRGLGLEPATVSSQILQRDRHAEYLTAVAMMGSSLEKFATEVRSLQRTEVMEVEEPFGKGQKGSSAMPHKRNPILAERICGLARVLRGNALAGMENITLWHERDISHSSAERIIIPDSTTLLHYMVVKFRGLVEGLVVHPERMRENLERMGGLAFSGRVLLALVRKGLAREEAYRLVQRNAMDAWQGKGGFRQLLAADAEVCDHLGEAELNACFDLDEHLRHIGAVLERWEAANASERLTAGL